MKKILLLCLVISFFSCKKSNHEGQESHENHDHETDEGHDHDAHDHSDNELTNELVKTKLGVVIDLHDEAHAKMSEIIAIRTQMKDSNKPAFTANITELDKAHDGMMDWMNNFKLDELKDMPEAEALSYLEQELINIKTVKDNIEASIKTANAALKSN